MAKPPPRLFVNTPLRAGAEVALDKAQAHYLCTVLRLSAGDTVLLFDGEAGEWSATIAEAGRKAARLTLDTQTRSQVSVPPLTLYFAPLKKGPMDFVVQKATELGVAVFQPVMTARTIASRVALDRLEAIAREAAEQSERLDLPAIAEPVSLDEVLRGSGRLYFCDEAGDDPAARWGGETGHAPLPADGLASATPGEAAGLLIGPEGGFTPEERDAIRAREGTVPISLGPRILKAETAALAAIVLWQARAGDWRAPA